MSRGVGPARLVNVDNHSARLDAVCEDRPGLNPDVRASLPHQEDSLLLEHESRLAKHADSIQVILVNFPCAEQVVLVASEDTTTF